MPLFSSVPTSYADEQLGVHLVDLSTLPVTTTAPTDLPSDVVPLSADSPFARDLHHALTVLTASKAPPAWYVAHLLDKLSESRGSIGTQTLTSVDVAAEAEVLTRSISIIWAYVLQVFVDSALALEDDSVWWERCLDSRGGVLIYLVQSMLDAFNADIRLSYPSMERFDRQGQDRRGVMEECHCNTPLA